MPVARSFKRNMLAIFTWDFEQLFRGGASWVGARERACPPRLHPTPLQLASIPSQKLASQNSLVRKNQPPGVIRSCAQLAMGTAICEQSLKSAQEQSMYHAWKCCRCHVIRTHPKNRSRPSDGHRRSPNCGSEKGPKSCDIV